MRTCQVCGCVDDRACITDHGPCFWASHVPPICSGCVHLVAVVAENLNRAPAEISADKTLEDDLGGDELDRINIVMDLERAYKVRIRNADFAAFNTIGELMVIVHQLRSARVRAA